MQKPQAIEEQNGKRKTEFEIYFCYLKLEDPRSSEFGLGDIIFFLNIYIFPVKTTRNDDIMQARAKKIKKENY